MIDYTYSEEKIVALHLAELLNDAKAIALIEQGRITNSKDATYLSQFFWKMIELSEEENRRSLGIPCEGGAQYWTDKLYNTFGNYLESVGYGDEWNKEIDNA